MEKTQKLISSLAIFPSASIKQTADYYVNNIGFEAVQYLDCAEPHICLYRDGVEIVLIKSSLERIVPNRCLHGYGYDGYFTTNDVEEFYNELLSTDAKIAKQLKLTDYNNHEFVFEDIEGRWIAVGKKQDSKPYI